MTHAGGLARRLRVAWGRLCEAVFWGLYRLVEVSPLTRMAHRDSEQHERRIEKLEHDVARLTTALRTCVGCIEGLTELTEQSGDLTPKSLAPRCWCGLPAGHELGWVSEILTAPSDTLAPPESSAPSAPLLPPTPRRRPFAWAPVDELLSHGLLARCLPLPQRARAPPRARAVCACRRERVPSTRERTAA